MRYTISLIAASLAATAALAEVPAVVTDIPPVHALAAMVMGDLGAPVLLLDQGADAHDFQLRPSQARAVAGAGLVVWVGPAMSPWLDRALDGLGRGAPRLALLSVAGTELRDYGADTTDHGHAPDETHGHRGTDPHAWLDPGNAAVWVDAIAAELARLDPANAAAYAANAAAARDRITAAAARAQAALAPARDRLLVVHHDAYGYFAAHFGLTLRAIAGGDAAAPGAGGLRGLVAAGAACVFPEANHDAGLAAQVAADTGARLGGALDPEGAGLPPGPDLYPALLAGLAGTIAACLAP